MKLASTTLSRKAWHWPGTRERLCRFYCHSSNSNGQWLGTKCVNHGNKRMILPLFFSFPSRVWWYFSVWLAYCCSMTILFVRVSYPGTKTASLSSPKLSSSLPSLPTRTPLRYFPCQWLTKPILFIKGGKCSRPRGNHIRPRQYEDAGTLLMKTYLKTTSVPTNHFQALLVRERILGPAHPDTSYYIRYRGAVYADMGHFERCITLWM